MKFDLQTVVHVGNLLLQTDVLELLSEQVDEETDEFIGPVSTTATEDGNWRLKYDLGVPYARCRTTRVRTALAGAA